MADGALTSEPVTLTQIDGLAALKQISRPGTGQFAAVAMRDRRPPPLRDLTQPQAVLKRVGPAWPLVAVLLLQAALSLRLIWANTAFQDEALYLWSGHMEWLHWLKGATIPNYASYFSGAPVLYPPLGALADGLGGLAAARLLSLAFMLTATVLLWSTAGRLFGHRTALGAAGLFALLGVTQVLGAFATYDAMALCLLAFASWLTVRAHGRVSEPLIIAAAVAMALANGTKYASALWDPIVIAMAVLTAQESGWPRAIFRGIRLTAYAAAIIGIALHIGGHSYVHGLLFTTLKRQATSTNSSAWTVLHDSFNWVGIVFLLALLGLAASRRSTREKMLIGVLTLAVLLAPVEQARIHTTISLHKHVAFGAWFAAIAAGYALARASEVHRWKGWRISFAVAIFTAVIGLTQVNTLYLKGWPNTAQTTAVLGQLMPRVGCPCMISDYTIAEYYLNIQTPAFQITGPYAFSYYNSAQHKEYAGLAAYIQAVKAHYFTIIQLDPEASGPVYRTLSRTLKSTSDYVEVASLPNSLSPDTPLQIWRYEP